MTTVHTKFIDDLSPEDTVGERLQAIVSEAAKELISEYGEGEISYSTYDGFDDGEFFGGPEYGYFWVKVKLTTSTPHPA